MANRCCRTVGGGPFPLVTHAFECLRQLKKEAQLFKKARAPRLHHFDFPFFCFAMFGVHLKQIACEQSSFVSAGTGARLGPLNE